MKQKKPLTGRKVLIILLSAFGVMIGANMALVYSALSTFPGLDVKNTYVASQQFDRLRNAQEALGWSTDISYASGMLRVEIFDSAGQVVRPESLRLRLVRATYADDDRELEPLSTATGYSVNADLPPGNWRVWIDAQSQSGVAYSIRVPLIIRKIDG
jgi:nitrogen fixation protein FixH